MKMLTGGQLRWLRTFLFLLLALPLSPLMADAERAEAADPYTIAGEWEITFDVRDGKMRAFWIGRVWDYNGGDEQIKAERIEDISSRCIAYGEPVFGDSDVTFDGEDDYITCMIPDFQAFFAEMDPALAHCRCQFTGPPYAAANITPEQSTSYQPVIHHRRLQLDVTQLDAKSLRIPFLRKTAEVAMRNGVRAEAAKGLGQAQLTLHFLDNSIESRQSNIFSGWQQDGYQIWMGYDAARYVASNSPDDDKRKYLADSGLWDDVSADHTEGFFMWESEATPSYTAEPLSSGFGMAPGTLIYIGTNPDTDEYFEGVIRAVAVDPGCRGH